MVASSKYTGHLHHTGCLLDCPRPFLTSPGKCYRLYTEAAYKNEMLPTSIPEIQVRGSHLLHAAVPAGRRLTAP